MQIPFSKYQGTGNDFILIDNRAKNFNLSKEQVAYLCDRHFGIGADGLMLLEHEDGYDFKMVYYNSDGNESTMCGNGGRCITAFAHYLGIINNQTTFLAIDGPHMATINENKTVSLHMQDVQDINILEDYTILNTGSPHYVLWMDDVANTDVYALGKTIRNQDEYQPKGINVNFVEEQNNALYVRTYERGVEDETLSCGTGVTASAIAATGKATGEFTTTVHTPGGKLTVSFTKDSDATAKNVVLSGPATFVFKGEVVL